MIGLNGAVETLRGSPQVIDGITYLPTFHPQDALDRKNYEQSLNPQFASADDDSDSDSEVSESDSETKDRSKTSRKNFRFWFGQDVGKAVRICREGLRHNTCNYILQPESTALLNWMAGLKDQHVYFDIETTLDTKQITCFSLSVDAKEVWAIPVIGYDQKLCYDTSILCNIFGALAGVFRRNTIVVHNAAFDLFILCWKYHIPPPPSAQIVDTMVMHHRLYAEIEKSLGHCVSLYTDQPYHKDEGVFQPKNKAQERQLLLYNAKDVETLALVYEGLHERAKNIPGAIDSWRQANASIRTYLTMSLRGLRLNTDALCKHIDALERRREIIENRVLATLVGYPLNPRSPKQVANYLYNELRLPQPRGDELTGKKALYKLALKHDIPAIKVILAIRRWSREKGALGFRMWHWKTDAEPDRATCAYLVTGTDTYRLSSRALLKSKEDKGYGTNLQNWNKDRTRYLVIPGPGNILVQVDQAGAEALVVAWCAPKGRLRELFRVGIKPHVFVALHLFQEVWRKSFDSAFISRCVTAEPADLKALEGWAALCERIKESDHNPPQTRYYYLAKQCCHASNYGIKGPTFILNILEKSEGQIALPLEEGNRFLSVYRDLFPETVSRNIKIRHDVETNRILYNRFGYPRTFTRQLQTDHDFKSAYAYDPQSTVGTITNLAATEIQNALDSGAYEGFVLLQNNHDSLLAECGVGDQARVAGILRQHLNRRMCNDSGEEFTMRSEASAGMNWRDMEELR